MELHSRRICTFVRSEKKAGLGSPHLNIRGVLQHGLPGRHLSLGHREVALDGVLSAHAGHLPLVLHLQANTQARSEVISLSPSFFLLSFPWWL